MADVRAYYLAVSKTAERLRNEYLDGCLYLTSIEDPARGLCGGSVAHVTVQNAAELIVKGEARPSTEAEIQAFNERAERFARGIAATENKFKYRTTECR